MSTLNYRAVDVCAVSRPAEPNFTTASVLARQIARHGAGANDTLHGEAGLTTTWVVKLWSIDALQPDVDSIYDNGVTIYNAYCLCTGDGADQ